MNNCNVFSDGFLVCGDVRTGVMYEVVVGLLYTMLLKRTDVCLIYVSLHLRHYFQFGQ